MSEEKVLREAENKVEIEGVLLEIRHNEWKSGEGLNIELDIQVAENEMHTVKGMSRYKKQDGTDNGIAKGFQTIINEFKSAAEYGKEEADKVRVTQGRIELNEYYGQDGKLRSFPQISTNFVNRVKQDEEFKPRAEFMVEMMVKSVKEETNKEGEETGRAILEGFIPLYGGKVIPMTFKVIEEGSEYVLDNYEKGDTVFVYGDIVNFKEKIVRVEKATFGEDKEIITHNTVREYLIKGGKEAYDEDSVKAYDPELISKALVERETYLKELEKQSKNTNSSTKKGGFGGKKGGNKKKDLPF